MVMNEQQHYLKWRVVDALRSYGTTQARETLAQGVVKQYSQPLRHYHSVAHILTCLAQFDANHRAFEDPFCAEAALIFHDVVYLPQAPGNEQQSATYAAEQLRTLDVPEQAIASIGQLIMDTTHDHVPSSSDGKLISDIDVLVLAGDEKAYDAYALAVRREYPDVPDDLYEQGRSLVLEHLLSAPVFHSDLFSHLNHQAQLNLQRELAMLSR